MSGTPKAPDPYQTANAQMGANVDTALANQAMGWGTQSTPWGSQTTSQSDPRTVTMSDGSTRTVYGTNTATTLNPALQSTLDATMGAQTSMAQAQQQQAGNVQKQLSTPFSYAAGTPGLTSTLGKVSLDHSAGLQTSLDPRTSGIKTSYDGANDFAANRDQYTRALMDRQQPALDQARSSADANMMARGIGIGSQAYGDTMRGVGQNENDARLAAILAGGEEQARMVGMSRDAAAFNNQGIAQQFQQDAAAGQFGNAARQQDFMNGNNATLGERQAALEAGQFGNQARQQSIQEQTALRNQPINELSALSGQTQVSSPQFNQWQQGSMPTVDMAGLIQQNYANRLGASQAKWQGLGSLLGAGSLFAMGGF